VSDELARPRFQQPLAIRFLTAEPGPLPTGKVRSWSGLDRVLAFPGVVQADVFLTEGEEIRPVRLDGDRRGYVIAVADTNVEALERAEAAARLLDVEVEAA
jgi:L-amino acid ligase C-terminal domain 2